MLYLLIFLYHFIPHPAPAPVHDHPGVCKVQKMTKGADGRVQYIQLEYGRLFRFTPKEMVPYLHGGALVESSVQLIKDHGEYRMILQMTVHATRADKYFGGIADDNDIRMILINGSSVYPKLIDVYAPIDYKDRKDKHIYRASYKLSKRDVKALQKWELDGLGLFWKKGFEEYDIRNVDFFVDRLACIKKIVKNART